MKRVTSLFIVVLASACFSAAASAAELTLDDCIELALEKRASIIRARGAQSSASARKLAALGAFLPDLRASYGYSKGKETNIENPLSDITEQDKGPSKSLDLNSSWTVFAPGDWFQYAAASAAKASSQLDVLASEQDLITAVKVAYYAYLAAEQNISVQEEAVKRAEEQLKLIESRFELGSASKSDVLRQKVQYGNDQLAMLRATNAVIQSKADLAYTIGLDPRDDHQFATDFRVREYAGTLDEAIAFGLEHNPRLLSSVKTSDEARHTLWAARSGYLPTMSLFFGFNRFEGTQAYPTSFDYSSNERTWGFRISYPIFDGFFREKQVTDAKVFRNNSMADLADSRNSTIASVKSSYLEIAQLKKQVEVSTENVAAAEEDFRITQEKYNLGAATILDLLTAQVSLKEAQVALIRVQFDLNLAVARLENAMGKM
ncbi:MAG: TolC family protein [Candidatus Zixiibacteriota bacterium]